MALIGRNHDVPKKKFVDFLGKLSEDEIIIFLRPDPQYYTATNMAISMVATCIGRYGSPVKASDLLRISQLGIFSTWEVRHKIGVMCDEGYFSRQHVGLEEYFSPEDKFKEFIKKTPFERRSSI